MCSICTAFRPYDDNCDYERLQAEGAIVSEGADAPNDNSSTYAMDVGDIFQGTVESGGDRDWVAVTLTAGVTYEINLKGSPSGVGTLSDPITAIYDADGIYLDGNDDGGVGTESLIIFTPATTGTYFVLGRGYSTSTGTYELSVTAQAAPPPPPVMGTMDEMATYLTDGYWTDNGSAPHKFDTSSSTTITVNIDALTLEGQQLARWAMEAWEAVADIQFSEISGAAQITFDDDDAGASAGYGASGGFTTSTDVNVSTDWLATNGTQIGSYSFQTYLHEIGHTLGLGHQGNYDGSGSYGTDNKYINDSWQLSVMSYFSQGENTDTTATEAETVSTMMVDVLAIQNLYGAAGAGSLTDGATTYGVGHTLGASWLGQLFDAVNGDGYASSYDGTNFSLTLTDIGGHDLLDLSNDTFNQNVYLTDESISDVMGLSGNLMIARDTEIEDFNAGSGDDTIRGNGAANTVWGNDGVDTLQGFGGKDVLYGGLGDDTLKGGDGRDFLKGGAGADVLNGGTGIDIADYSEATAGMIIDLGQSVASTGDAAGDTFSQMENIMGSDFDDDIRGNGKDNRLMGEIGDDRIDGRGGNDILLGAAGFDVLLGGNGNDTILAGSGRDWLAGGAGDDIMTGGTGFDSFVFGNGADVITDFDADQLRLDDALWANASLSNSEILDFASVVGADTVFDFGSGNTLTLENYTDIAGLDPALVIF